MTSIVDAFMISIMSSIFNPKIILLFGASKNHAATYNISGQLQEPKDHTTYWMLYDPAKPHCGGLVSILGAKWAMKKNISTKKYQTGTKKLGCPVVKPCILKNKTVIFWKRFFKSGF